MAWECGECGAIEGRDSISIGAVCHHCGKPLCPKHARLIVDDAFAEVAGPLGTEAFHCDDCKHEFHPRSVIVGSHGAA